MATLPNFIAIQHAERAEAEFRKACAERAREYVYRVRARRAAKWQARAIGVAVFTTIGTLVFVSWQLASVITWLLNN